MQWANRLTEPCESLEERLQRVIAAHFHPADGTAFWLERARTMRINPLRDIRTPDDLHLLGHMGPEDLTGRPLLDYIPKRFHNRLDRFVTGQTGGATGAPAWTAYRDDEFHEAFIFPFIEAAVRVGFPARTQWLYVGPSGPHIIGKAARCLACGMGSPDPFCVDFDPRWARRLPPGSFAQKRYLQHVVEQALAVLDVQPIDVLFTTPVVLQALAGDMSTAQRERIRGVHYGGMEVTPSELLDFQSAVFPSAVHLSGYGNTLFGCALELAAHPGRDLDYYPSGVRWLIETLDVAGHPVAEGAVGRVCCTRLDESMLIVRLLERDQAMRVPPPADSPAAFALAGVRNPTVWEEIRPAVACGLY